MHGIYNGSGFEQFWAAYPTGYHIGKRAAIAVWNQLKPTEALVAQMLETLRWQRTCDQWQRGYVPNPKTWLRQGRWDDDRPPARRQYWSVEECPHEPKCGTPTQCDIQRRIQAGKQA